MKIYIGIDNGVSGSIGILSDSRAAVMIKVPTFSEQSYTKGKQNITRIDHPKLYRYIKRLWRLDDGEGMFMMMERPMVNPGRFKATMSALRALESCLIIRDKLKIPLRYCDSKEWQKLFLPYGCEGAELKSASRDIGKRMYPNCEQIIMKHGDADGLLIATYCKKVMG